MISQYTEYRVCYDDGLRAQDYAVGLTSMAETKKAARKDEQR